MLNHSINKRIKNVKHKAIFDHLLTCDYVIIFDELTILSNDCDNFSLLINKSFSIVLHNPILNETVKLFPFL